MSAGDDIFVASTFLWGSETFDGGEGNDTVDYSNSVYSQNINLQTNTTYKFGGHTDTLISIENIIGTFFGDTITGDNNSNNLNGLFGNDMIYGGLGNDQLFGGYDNDYLFGEEGSDSLYGGEGDDFLLGNHSPLKDGQNDYLFGDDGNDYLFSEKGADLLNGGNGIDYAIYNESLSAVSINLATATYSGGDATSDTLISIENIYGSSHNDTLSGDANANLIIGNLGNDTIKGRNGDDSLFGDNGSDYLEGGNGNDTLNGGEGIDTLKGSAGIDTFVYTNIADAGDIIQDFNVKLGEKIDLTALLQNAFYFKQDQAFTAGYIRTAQNGANTDIFIDMDGSAHIWETEVLLATLQNVAATTLIPSVFIVPEIGINFAPIAANDTFISTQNKIITGNLLSNNGHGVDDDADGDILSVTAQTFNTTHGSVVISADGSFTYTPITGHTGEDIFEYTLYDGHFYDTGTVSITLHPSITGTNGNDKITGTMNNDIIFGEDGNDTLKGAEGSDVIYGGNGVDVIEGNNGFDILYGGSGADSLKGGAGIDTYVFSSITDAGDTIIDYRYDDGEQINISDILDLYDPLTNAITDFVQITQSGLNSILAVDIDGGANNFVVLATLLNTSNLTDEQALVNSSRLLV